jgi:hypothetical protein
MYLNATENTKQSAFLHSLDDAFNIYNVESNTCSATTQSSYYCLLLLSVFLNNTVENTLLRFHGDTFNIYTGNMSISTTQKTIKITRVAFYNCCCLYCCNLTRSTVYIKEALTLMATSTTFPRQQWLRESDTMICYTYTAYLVSIFMGDVLTLLVIPCQMG